MKLDLERVLDKSLTIAQEAADYIKSQFGKVSDSQIQEKELNSLVSYVDQTAERLLVEKLSLVIPNSGFMTEEDTVNKLDEDYIWVIDPLDGTTNFLMGIPHFAVSVALNYKGETIIGIVIEVNSGDVFHASLGNGAYLNGAKISVGHQSDLKDVIIATGFPYTNTYDVAQYLKAVQSILTRSRGLRRMGSAALDLCFTACGRFGGYYESRLNPWDVAAGILIVKEAGGKVSDFKGGKNYGDGREVVACVPDLQSVLLELIKELN